MECLLTGPNRAPANLAVIGIVTFPVTGDWAVAAEIIRFGDYRKTRDVAPVSGDIETRLTRLNALAAEVFRALSLDAAALDAAAVGYTIANAAAAHGSRPVMTDRSTGQTT